uniref:Homeotic protein female sterile n=1 Tax=Cacopsylla melanoneura TaxID=428564 RepID=A0A8D8ZCV7_9HEMI
MTTTINSEECDEVYDSTEEDMTYDEKRDLIQALVKEPDMKVINFIRIVETREPRAIMRNESNDIEIDFDKLHASTLRALELKLKEYHAAIDEKTPKFRGNQ